MSATLGFAAERELARWYQLIPLDVQVSLVNDNKRFKIVPAGRRSGKTERFKRKLVKEAMRNPNEMYFAGAPTQMQAKRIFWNDLKLLSFASTHTRRPSESELTIFFDNGSTITVLGMDKPSRFEGIPWTGGGFDEFADMKPAAWSENILPALDTVHPLRPDYRAWCWVFGVPDGLNHYYDMAQYAQNSGDNDWGYYHWTSEEILPPDVIAGAKRRLSERQYRQEYMASFETAEGKIYDNYSKANHTDAAIMPHEQLVWMHDQNYTPLSSAVGVIRDDALYLLDEIVLTSAISKQSALEFVERYAGHENKNVIIYGDPAGKAGEKHGHASDYTDIEEVLAKNGWQFTRDVAAAHPAIKDRQNAVRAKICTADGHISLFVNPVTAPWCDKGLATVQLQQGSTFQEDQKNQYQHITTAIGYCVSQLWPVEDAAAFVEITMPH